METQSSTIEFKTIPFHYDMDDLSQECTAYMKTKQFMAKRINQQQEEIELLKQSVMYHSSKHIQMMDMVRSLQEQIEFIKDNTNKKESNNNNLNLSGDEFTASIVCDDSKDYVVSGYENVPQTDKDSNILKNENIELNKEIERLKYELLDKTLEFNKIKSDKFILFNELNELVLTLKRVDLDKLNTFYKKNNTNPSLNKLEMSSSKGIKYNILSAQSHICKILRSDLNNRKMQKTESNVNDYDKIQMDNYVNLLKKIEEDFDSLLDRKLSKRSKSFYYY